MKISMVVLASEDVGALAFFYQALTGWSRVVDGPTYVELASPAGVHIGLAEALSYARSVGAEALAVRSPGPSGAEVYFQTDDVDRDVRTAVRAGGRLLSAAADRPWGERVAYVQDPAGNVCALGHRAG